MMKSSALSGSPSPALLAKGARVLEQRIQLYVAWFTFTAGVLWALHLLLASQGVLTEDGIAHFVISREAWHRPALMLHHWGRPLNTLINMPAALLGLGYVRLTSLTLSSMTVLLTFLLSRKLEVGYAFLTPALLWFQPWFANYSIQPALTEIPFSLMFVLTAYLFISGRLLLASALIGLFPLVRHEMIIFTLLWFLFRVVVRDWRGAFAAALPVAVYTTLYVQVFGSFPDHDFPIFGPFTPGHHHLHIPLSRHANWLHFPHVLLMGAGVPVAGLALYSIPWLIRSIPRLVVFAWYGAHMAMMMVLYYVGFGSDERYVLPLAPAVSIAAAVGLQSFASKVPGWLKNFSRVRMKSEAVAYGVTAICIIAVLMIGIRAKPEPFSAQAMAAKAAAQWLREQGFADTYLVATSAWFHSFLPGHLMPPRRDDPEAIFSDPPRQADMPSGAIAVWDPEYSDEYGLKRAAFLSDRNRWRMLKEFEVNKGYIAIYRKQSQ